MAIRYDVDIVRLSWTSGDSEEVFPVLKHINRMCPKDVYIEGAHLDGHIACFGSGRDWLFWDWKKDTAAVVTLPGAMVRSPSITVVQMVLINRLGREHCTYTTPRRCVPHNSSGRLHLSIPDAGAWTSVG